ncbi:MULTISPECIES: malto-oligosyltrehalose synthase [unclassified Roseitalea]|uniref:malto-oligosyltrehalose synthase n=1 Tax=unclassified Roseitalea TaxID=2639107 RepID=UPI00273F59A6|nr:MULTISPECIES: malto-oligosyltrehalose synthase [unclassified Roseitalea]
MTVPRATYRLQFRGGMDFDHAASLAPYLARLGISHLYASPIFAAMPGSTHGYDVIDHNRIDDTLGGRAGFDRLTAALDAEGLGLILDIVPNHMAASPHNGWWRDVLSHGPQSAFAGHFDIDWSAPKLVLPTLGKPYGDALCEGELGLARDGQGLCLTYFEHAFPLCPVSWPAVHDAIPTGADELRGWLSDPGNAEALDERLSALSDDGEALHRIHEMQHWRLAYWRLARDGLTYRRFFEIADLVGVRVDDAAVFDDVHRLTLGLVETGQVQGLRIDHVDGLADPAGYLARLRQRVRDDVPIWVEKILGADEPMCGHWPVQGTTGYELANAVTGLLTDADGSRRLATGFDAHAGRSHDPAAMLAAAKREILTVNLAAELHRLVALARRVAVDDPRARDRGPDTVRRALIAIACAMPVYRTYLADPDHGAVNDRLMCEVEADAARAVDLEDAGAVRDLIRLLVECRSDTANLLRARFEQTTGALMAKALEDTHFYRHVRLLSANEVGAEPEPVALAPTAFETFVAHRMSTQQRPLNGTATHDTKRGEDARMRIAAIADDAGNWTDAVHRWDDVLGKSGADMPDAEDRWLFYQALLGAWEPDDAALAARMREYMIKAAREAKRRTRWTSTDTRYETALADFVSDALGNSAFVADFATVSGPLIAAGERRSLVQLALKLTLPGIADIYQGTEWADLSLVDPDNRRPVDFAARQAMLAGQPVPGASAFDRAKMTLMARLLQLRRRLPELFACGAYLPLEPANGPARNGAAIGFARVFEERAITVIAETPPVRRSGPAAFVLPRQLADRDWRALAPDAPLEFRDGAIAAKESPDRCPVVIALAH